MTRRTKLFALGVTSVFVLLVMAAIDRRLEELGGHGIIDLQFAGSVDQAQTITREWGDEGRSDARLSLLIDFLYLSIYGAFLYIAASAVAAGAAARGWEGLQRAAGLAAPGGLAAATFDALENVLLLGVLAGDGPADGSPLPVLATAAAAVKWTIAVAVLAVIGTGVVRLVRAR